MKRTISSLIAIALFLGLFALFSPKGQGRLYAGIYSIGPKSVRLWTIPRLKKLGETGDRGLVLALDDGEESIAQAAERALGARDLNRIGEHLIVGPGDERPCRRARRLLFNRLVEAEPAIFRAAKSSKPATRRRAFAIIEEILSALIPARPGGVAKLDFICGIDRDVAFDTGTLVPRENLEVFASEAYAKLIRAGLRDQDSEVVNLSVATAQHLQRRDPFYAFSIPMTAPGPRRVK